MQEVSNTGAQPLLSVVVPVYNVVHYLDQCLASVFAQGFADGELEVLLVDDGSTDGSALLAEKWARRRVEAQVVHRPNGGLSAARNTGLDRATGRYLTFLDSDDIVPPGAYRDMVEALEQSGSDFITSGVFRFAARSRLAKPFPRNLDLFEESARGLTLSERPEYVRDFAAWNKIYRREFFVGSGVRFPEGRIYEDIATSPILYSRAAAFDVYGAPGYFWRDRPGGITRTVEPVKALDRLRALDSVQRFFAESGVGERQLDEFGFALVDYNLRWVFLDFHRFDEATRETILSEAQRLLAPVPDEAIARVQSPLDEWAMLAKRGRTSGLAEILGTPQHLPNLPVGAREAPPASAPSRPGPRERIGKLVKPDRRAMRGIKHALLYLAMRPAVMALPLKRRTAVFSAYWGRKFSLSDAPAALCFELNRSNPDFESIVFAAETHYDQIRASVESHASDPSRIRVIRDRSLLSYYYLWRAKYLFNDVNFVIAFRDGRLTGKRRGQIQIQTTHGIPIKKMGVDSEAAIPPSDRAAFIARSKRNDYLVSTSPYVAKTFADSHRISPKILETGLPQHDPLFHVPSAAEVRALRIEHGLDPDKRLVLYAPTFRGHNGAVFKYLVDFHLLQEEFGDDYQFIAKPHSYNHTQLGLIDFRELSDQASAPADSPFVKIMGEIRKQETFVPVSTDPEALRVHETRSRVDVPINDLLFAADVVVSDYSSLMFGYTHLRKPLVLFTPDAEHYNATRGTYFDVDEVAPGAVAKTNEDLVEAIRLAEDRDAWNARYEDRREAFVRRFLLWERGGATRKILEQLDLI